MNDDAHRAQLNRLLNDCLDLLDDGQAHTARQLAGQAVELATDLGPLASANAWLVAGMAEHDADDEAAADMYVSAARLAGQHPADPDAARIYIHAKAQLAGLHRAHGRYQKAEDTLIQALDTIEVYLEPADPPEVAMLHNELGVVSKFSGKFHQAATSYRQALDILKDTDSPDPQDLATLWHNLGGLAHARGDYQAAEEPARRAVALREQVLGPNHPLVAADRAALAPILFELGQLEEAESLLHDALEVFKHADGYGKSHPDYAIALGNLATVIHQRGDHETALTMYHNALSTLERALGPDHPDLAAIMISLATLRRTTGEVEEAEALEACARHILTGSVQPDHPTLMTLNSRTDMTGTPGSPGREAPRA
jgi:tetratricopeptide (TPR) repeat protein